MIERVNSIPPEVDFPQAPYKDPLKAYASIFASASEKEKLQADDELTDFRAARQVQLNIPKAKFRAFYRFAGKKISKKTAAKFFSNCQRMNAERELLRYIARIPDSVSRSHLPKKFRST